MNEEGRMRGGAGRVPRPQGEGERSLESSNFSSLGRRQRAFESSNLSFVSCHLSRKKDDYHLPFAIDFFL
jgi:hypothetical protein